MTKNTAPKPASRAREVHHVLELQSDAMQIASRRANDLSRLSDPVLVIGESGVGKELIARKISGVESGKKLVAINAYDFVDNADHAHSTIFGHLKGSFTGSDAERAGAVAEANGGTLFIDEIGSMPQSVQGQLLRFLESGEYVPLGSDRPRTSNCRIIAATNQVDKSKYDLRDDLFWRFPFLIELSPIRERREDVIQLFFHFCDELSGRREVQNVPYAVAHILLHYNWPGNVRELKNRVKWYMQVDRFELLQKQKFYMPSVDHLLEPDQIGGIENYYTWFMNSGQYFGDMVTSDWIDADFGIFPQFWLAVRVKRTELVEFAKRLSIVGSILSESEARSRTTNFLIAQVRDGLRNKRFKGQFEAHHETAKRTGPHHWDGTISGNLEFMKLHGAKWAQEYSLTEREQRVESSTKDETEITVGPNWTKKRILKEIGIGRIRQHNNNKKAAAASLSIDRATLSKWIKQ